MVLLVSYVVYAHTTESNKLHFEKGVSLNKNAQPAPTYIVNLDLPPIER